MIGTPEPRPELVTFRDNLQDCYLRVTTWAKGNTPFVVGVQVQRVS